MATSKKKFNKHIVALLQGGLFVAIEVAQETKDAFVGRVFGVNRNQNDTGYTFIPLRFFRVPTIYKSTIICVENMPDEMAKAYAQFLSSA